MEFNKKPRLFIASSVENLETAHVIQENLEYNAEVTVWSQGIFNLTRPALTSLLKAIDSYDFAIFIFAPDDITTIKSEAVQTVRDNVVFELGLFMAALGEDRTFIVVPRGIELHLPTDIIGITPATYDPIRSDNNLQAALGPACTRIKKVMNTIGIRDKTKLGLRTRISLEFKNRYNILNKASDKAIDVKNYSQDDGAVIHLWPLHSGDNQIWEVRHRKLN